MSPGQHLPDRRYMPYRPQTRTVAGRRQTSPDMRFTCGDPGWTWPDAGFGEEPPVLLSVIEVKVFVDRATRSTRLIHDYYKYPEKKV